MFDYNLNGQRYLELLRNQVVPALRATLTEDEFRRTWFQQDGCPAHNTIQVRNFLREQFDERIISLNGPISWPPRSPDLSPLDFYLWGHTKNEVYEFDPPATIEILRQRVLDTFRNSINGNTLARVVRKTVTNCQKCLDANGRHFANL